MYGVPHAAWAFNKGSKIVKRVNSSGFRLILADFELNSLDQKNFDLNGSRKLRT